MPPSSSPNPRCCPGARVSGFVVGAADTALVVSCGSHCSTVIPVVRGVADLASARRLDVGGGHMIEQMLALAHLRHPHLRAHLSYLRAAELVAHHSYVAADYGAELRRWQADAAFAREHCHVFQLPFDLPAAPSAEELAARDERRRLNIRRLQDMHRKKDAAKVRYGVWLGWAVVAWTVVSGPWLVDVDSVLTLTCAAKIEFLEAQLRQLQAQLHRARVPHPLLSFFAGRAA